MLLSCYVNESFLDWDGVVLRETGGRDEGLRHFGHVKGVFDVKRESGALEEGVTCPS